MSERATSPELGRGHSSATVSDCSLYRYDLTRRWGDEDGPQVVWVMLNPSTADGTLDDPTIRRCIGFTKAWRYDGLVVVNLFAFRSTDPKALLTAAAPQGPLNKVFIERHITDPRTELVVAAWGAFRTDAARLGVESIAHKAGKPMRCLGRTKSGAPRHPLYVRADAPLHPWGPWESTTQSDDRGGPDGEA